MRPDAASVLGRKVDMYVSDNTPLLFKGFFSLGDSLCASNRWICLSQIIPWEKVDRVYSENFSPNSGRRALDSRLVCGLFIVKYIKNLTDEETIRDYEENPYIQAFCGRMQFLRESKFSVSMLSEKRKRLNSNFWDFWNSEILILLDEQKVFKFSKNKKDNNCFWSSIFSTIKARLFHF